MTHHRIAIVDPSKCKPTKCRQECRRVCPPQLTGKQVITINTKATKTIKVTDIEDLVKTPRATISEQLCIGCGQCVKHCPFGAITIVKLPEILTEPAVFRYGPNQFALFRLPAITPGKILGLLGPNGVGKSTVIKLLAGQLTPAFKDKHAFSARKVSYKTQDLTLPPLSQLLQLSANFSSADLLTRLRSASADTTSSDRAYDNLSGGERQRLAISLALAESTADLIVLDEPTTYLDIKQRMALVQQVKTRQDQSTAVVVIDHDIATLDYLTDTVSVLYGQAGAYGVTTKPMVTAEAINCYLAGYLPSDNLRIRAWSLQWSQPSETVSLDHAALLLAYPAADITVGNHRVTATASRIQRSQVTVVLGQNAIGKSTWLKWLAETATAAKLTVAVKPQLFSTSSEPVASYLANCPSQLLKELDLLALLESRLDQLSGGQRQRLELAKCLSQSADLYLLDEPSANLDVESRFVIARLLRRWVLDHHCSAVMIEHDLYLANYLADNMITVMGQPGQYGQVSAVAAVGSQLNQFLADLGITLRPDHNSKRPRVNQIGSAKDLEQRRSQQWYCY